MKIWYCHGFQDRNAYRVFVRLSVGLGSMVRTGDPSGLVPLGEQDWSARLRARQTRHLPGNAPCPKTQRVLGQGAFPLGRSVEDIKAFVS